MAKTKTILEGVLPCPFCGTPAETRENDDRQEASCPDGRCAGGQIWIQLYRWQKRTSRDFQAAYNQFEASLKAAQEKQDSPLIKAAIELGREIAGGRFEEDTKLADAHATAIRVFVRAYKESPNG